MSDEEIARTISEMKRIGRRNPYFVINSDPSLTDEQRGERILQLTRKDTTKAFIANVLSYGAWGLVIALLLGIAEPVTDRNPRRRGRQRLRRRRDGIAGAASSSPSSSTNSSPFSAATRWPSSSTPGKSSPVRSPGP